MSEVPRRRYKALDRFEVQGELGQGAGSRILHIRDPDGMQHYAMKVVVRRSADDEKYLDQAKHEFDVATRFDHPSLLKAYDIRVIRKWFREREVRTLLEYVNGQTVEQLKEFAVPLVAVIFAEVAAAASYMHSRGVFHADLKPNNIMVSKSGQVKVIDFGLAWLRGQKKDRVQGTPGYLAPEQMQDRVVNASTDIFNLGATIYRVLTGRMASGGMVGAGGKFVPSHATLTPAHEVNPTVPQTLSDLLGRCCATKPHHRPSSMSEVAESLSQVTRDLGATIDDLPDLLRRRT
jgi:serine/threonine-protein kinase